MPSDSAPTTKRRSAKTTVSQDDHRKRRRNRTTQSCLNCHATKRMCDRGRPCTRCTQLGLTGMCVYQVDDPATKSNTQDERSRLQDRIAELEAVIRELKNKPHPRWTDARETGLHSSPGSSGSSLKDLSYADAALENSPYFQWIDLLNWESSASSSPVSTPSPLLVSASQCPESLPPSSICHVLPWNHNSPAAMRPDAACNCMSEPACYNAAIELVTELRSASTVLSRSLNHCLGSQCVLSTKVRDLESLVVNALQHARLCPNTVAPTWIQVFRPPHFRPDEQQVKMGRDPLWDENGLPAYDESFMTAWIPPTGHR
ncbi:hypothetical protein DFH06DRAFT_415615 [Mycena polygramma]|nr:hypothetical protein DFH06DRAFT_415615 [Mycena polygramma]